MTMDEKRNGKNRHDFPYCARDIDRQSDVGLGCLLQAQVQIRIYLQIPQINQEMLAMGVRHDCAGRAFVQGERDDSTVHQDVCAEVDEGVAGRVYEDHHIASAVVAEEFVTTTHGEEEAAAEIHQSI